MLEIIKEILGKTLTTLIGFMFLGLSLFHMIVGLIGIEHHLGWFFVALAIAVSFMLKLILHLSIGSYFGMTDVLGLDPIIALLLLLPTILAVFGNITFLSSLSLFQLFKYARAKLFEKDDEYNNE